jgi:hypothetical protein
LKGVTAVEEKGNNVYIIESKSNITKEIQQLIADQGLVLLDLHRKEHTMESIFHELTKN